MKDRDQLVEELAQLLGPEWFGNGHLSGEFLARNRQTELRLQAEEVLTWVTKNGDSIDAKPPPESGEYIASALKELLALSRQSPTKRKLLRAKLCDLLTGKEILLLRNFLVLTSQAQAKGRSNA